MLIDDIKIAIKKVLPDADVLIDGADGIHFQAIVVSPSFTGLSLLKCQKLVKSSLSEFFQDGSLHALGLKTYTPEQWQSDQP